MTAPTRRGWLLVLAVALLLAGGAGGAWKWWHRAPPPEPPLPADISDPEVAQAVRGARQKVLDKPDDAGAWGLLGMTLEAHLYEAEADRCFAEAARLDPADGRWPYFRGLYALKYYPEHALPFLRQAAACRAAAEQQSAMRLRLAEALLEHRQLDEAEELFHQEERRAADNPRAAFGLGLIAVARGDDAAADKYLTVARTSPTARRPATAQLATLARAHGDSAAAEVLERDAAPRPGDAVAWPDPLVAQIVRLRVGPDSRAEELAGQVADLERQRRYPEAAALYLRQIEDKPTVPAYVGAARMLSRMDQEEQAAPLMRDAVRLDPESFQAHYWLALIQFLRAEKERQRSPDSTKFKEWLRETVEHAEIAARLKPDHGRNYLHWGLALKYLGDTEAAVAPLRKGVACQPSDFDLQYWLGEVLRETGRDEEARTYLENARQLKPDDPDLLKSLKQLQTKKD
jgi:Flp pilus assembly protein TadD